MGRNTSEHDALYVGIDVSLKTLSVAWGRSAEAVGQARTFVQTHAGFEALQRALRETGVAPESVVVVMEATSTYWMQAAVALRRAGYGVCVINPKQAHHFRLACQQQAKTDAMDARVLARLAASQALPRWRPSSEVGEAVQQRLVEHDQLVKLRQQARNALHALQQRDRPDLAVQARHQQCLDLFDQQLKQIDRELRTLLKDSSWASLFGCLCGIKGIGLLGAAWLLVITEGFTTCDSPEQLAAYLGLVPYRQDSGQHKGHKPLATTGHARARRALYQASVSATRFNPPIRDFYQRLRDRGKLVKVARCAATRKLVHQVFAIVRQFQAQQRALAPAPVPLAA